MMTQEEKSQATTCHKINVVLIFLLIIQVIVWNHNAKFMPKLGIFSEPPTLVQAHINSLGDEQFYFRFLALDLQNSGDTFGRYTPLREYDYSLLKKWLILLDDLDPKSNFLPSIASYYYSNTQNVQDVRYIIDYLEYTYDKDPKAKWWWLAQGTLLAFHKLHDKTLSVRLAIKLSATPSQSMPRWAQQMPAIILAEYGEKAIALAIIKDLANRYDDYSQPEINYMNYFIRKRLGYINETITKAPTKKDTTGWYMK